METVKGFENFPRSIILISNLVSLSTYALGFYIMLQLGLVFSFLYLSYLLYLEYRLISKHCINCYYWGKACGFGKGKLSSLFFKKGDSSKFCSKEFTWKDMIPDILVSLIPIITGIILLIIKFDLILLSALVLIVALTTTGNSYVRGKLTCLHCKQRELGCMADKLFSKKEEK